jgi:hypothetical protein
MRWLVLILFAQVVTSVRFLVNSKQEVCIYENLPKNEALATQILVDSNAKDFELVVLHLNDKGKTIDSTKTRLYNDLNVFVHQEGMRCLTRLAGVHLCRV